MRNCLKQAEYEEDFIRSKPTLPEYCQKLQRWRERYEKYLDSRPRVQTLDTVSHYLIEYPHSKYDEIEIPGQYTEVCDPLYTCSLYLTICNFLGTR